MSARKGDEYRGAMMAIFGVVTEFFARGEQPSFFDIGTRLGWEPDRVAQCVFSLRKKGVLVTERRPHGRTSWAYVTAILREPRPVPRVDGSGEEVTELFRRYDAACVAVGILRRNPGGLTSKALREAVMAAGFGKTCTGYALTQLNGSHLLEDRTVALGRPSRGARNGWYYKLRWTTAFPPKSRKLGDVKGEDPVTPGWCHDRRDLVPRGWQLEPEDCTKVDGYRPVAERNATIRLRRALADVKVTTTPLAEVDDDGWSALVAEIAGGVR